MKKDIWSTGKQPRLEAKYDQLEHHFYLPTYTYTFLKSKALAQYYYNNNTHFAAAAMY